MYLLYLDASGTVLDPNENYIVLAGVAIFERQIIYAVNALDEIAQRINPHHPEDIEFHGSVMYQARAEYKRLGLAVSRNMIRDGLLALNSTHESTRLFGVAIHKAAISPRDPIEYAFEQICNRFDRYLARLYREQNPQRGMIVFDESRYEGVLQSLAIDFRTVGHSWGVTRNIIEVPLFVNSKATRMVQLADLVSFALWRRYEKNDPQYFDIISSRFDRVGSVIHGLVHYTPGGDVSCDCPVCLQRRADN